MGVTAAVLSALLASLTFRAGLLALTYSATGWFTSDLATVTSWNMTWSPAHYDSFRNHYSDTATYLVRENADSALNVLVLGPMLGVLLGLVGAQLGILIPRGASNHPSRDP